MGNIQKPAFLVAAMTVFFCLGMAFGTYSATNYFLIDGKEKQRATFGLMANKLETPGLLFKDVRGNDRLYVGMDDTDEPVIIFYDDDRTVQLQIDAYYSPGGPGAGRGIGESPPPAKDWAWPESKTARLWDLTIWFVRPKKDEVQFFHRTPTCSNLRNAARTGAIDSKKITKQKLRYAHKHFADQLEPCSCCKSLFPAN
jgi:hypothetical protein